VSRSSHWRWKVTKSIRSTQLGEVQNFYNKKNKFYKQSVITQKMAFPEKLSQWENFYNFERPHGAHAGKTPYEVLKTLLKT